MAFAIYLGLFAHTHGKVTVAIQTEIGAGYVHLRVVIQRLEEMFVGHLDVGHPLEQVARPGVVHGELDKLAADSHVRRALGYVEAVRHWLLPISTQIGPDPRVLEPVPEVVAADTSHA